MKYLLSALVPALLAFAPPAFAAPKQGDVVIRHVTIVDVEAAKTIAGQAVVLKGGDIVAVGADAVIAKDWHAARTIEGKGGYLIPGLWDMHVHFGGGPELIEENKALLPLYVANFGKPFAHDNVVALSRIGMSTKPPGESIGNKGLGFLNRIGAPVVSHATHLGDRPPALLGGEADVVHQPEGHDEHHRGKQLQFFQ